MNTTPRLLVVLLAISTLAGCSTLETRNARLTRELQTTGLAAAAKLHDQAGRLFDDRLVVCNLRAAELAPARVALCVSVGNLLNLQRRPVKPAEIATS